MRATTDHVPDDLDVPVWGAEAMGKVINRTTRQAHHLLQTGKLPAKRVGHQYVSTPRKLLAAMGAL